MFLLFLAIYGLSYVVRHSSCPFNLCDKVRSKLLNNKHLGTLTFKLLDCPICLGFWCGVFVFLLSSQLFLWQSLILFGLAGSTIVYLGDHLFLYLEDKE